MEPTEWSDGEKQKVFNKSNCGTNPQKEEGMKKSIFLAIVVAAGIFLAATVPVAADNLSPIQYQVMGDKKRADAVAAYMTRHGYSAVAVVEPGVFGQLNGKKWPGVRVARFGAGEGEGVFIPVSDSALKKGLCSDQQELITALPKNWPPSGSEVPLVRPVQPTTKVIPDPCSCGDLPWPAKGIWADFPIGAYGVEIQDRPNEFFKKIKWVVREGDTIRTICCLKNSRIPGMDEMETAWGQGRRLSLWKDFGGCDGGRHCTTQILIFY